MPDIKDELIEALLNCPTIEEFGRREALIRQLPENIRHNLKTTNVPRIDVVQLVDWCMNYQDGLPHLIEQLRFFEGDSLGMARVDEVWLRIQATTPVYDQGPQPVAAVKMQQTMDTGAQAGRLPSRWLLALAGIGVALAIAGLWYWINHQQNMSQFATTPPVVVSSYPTSAGSETSNPAAVTTAQPTPFPPLPEVAPALTTTVLLLSSPLCATEQEEMETFLADATKTTTPPVVLESREATYAAVEDRAEVRSIGETDGVDMVIWCTDEDASTEIHFEALTQRAAPEVYEPPAISVPAQPTERGQRVALAVIDYLRRDYTGAEPVLRTAIDMSSETNVTATLTLLIGNAQTFSHAYEAAVDTYSQVVRTQPGWAFAWHNLGVAELYAAWLNRTFDKALSAFEQARTIDPGFDLPLISIALIYREIADDVPGSYEKAIAACEQAERSQDAGIRAQGMVCTDLTHLAGWSPKIPMPRNHGQKMLEDAATRYWAEPLALIGAIQAGYWLTNNDSLSRQQARTYYEKYLNEACDDVHLEESSQLYRHIIEYSLPQVNTIGPGS